MFHKSSKSFKIEIIYEYENTAEYTRFTVFRYFETSNRCHTHIAI